MGKFGLFAAGVVAGWLLGVWLPRLDRPKTDAGKTVEEPALPVKYELCFEAECTVIARFEKFDGCQFYEKFMKASCDSVSKPGTITCRTGEPSTAESHCTR